MSRLLPPCATTIVSGPDRLESLSLLREGLQCKVPVFEYRRLFWISEPDGICKTGCKRSGPQSEKHKFSSCCPRSTKLQDNLASLDISADKNLHKWPLEPEREVLSVLS